MDPQTLVPSRNFARSSCGADTLMSTSTNPNQKAQQAGQNHSQEERKNHPKRERPNLTLEGLLGPFSFSIARPTIFFSAHSANAKKHVA